METIIGKDLPDAECKYCTIHDPSSIVMCSICKMWFCNGRGITYSSHIVSHLMRAKHKEITLHKDGPFGETKLECYSCGLKNIFALGFVPAAESASSVVVILCRQPCAGTVKSSREANWNEEGWKPLIENRNLLSWLVKIPPKLEQLRVPQITCGQMSQLEELWKCNPCANVNDLEKPEPDIKPETILLRYADSFQYQNIYSPLVALEASYTKWVKIMQSQETVDVRWEICSNKKVIAHFNVDRSDEDTKLRFGDEVQLRQIDANRPWIGVGQVMKMPDNSNDEIALEMKTNQRIPFDCVHNYVVDFTWRSTPFDRMQQALKKFASDEIAVTEYIYRKMLGHDVEEYSFKQQGLKYISAPNTPELNRSQVYAVKQAIHKPLFLIQGPPGTGKTLTASVIAYHLVKQYGGPILVCAPSNAAVDLLAERIHRTNLKVIRIFDNSKEAKNSRVGFLGLQSQLRNFTTNTKLRKLQQQQRARKELPDQQQCTQLGEERFNAMNGTLKNQQLPAEKEFLQGADIICSTCLGAGDIHLSHMKFNSVLIDEASQAMEPECLIPIVTGIQQLILIGDQFQLGPTVMSKKASDAGLCQSLFERLIILGIRPFRLETQYRMHPELLRFSSNFFYAGLLQNGVSAEERNLPAMDAFPWPVPRKPLLFYAVQGMEEICGSGASYLNRAEASVVEKLATRFLKCGIKADQIGVITPYEGQRSYLIRYMKNQGTLFGGLYQEMEIGNVENFQGDEKDVMIVSCVRSSSYQPIGILNNPRELNVAITRARYGIVVVGNPQILSKQTLWNHLLLFYKDQNVLVEGTLDNWRESPIHRPKPKENLIAHSMRIRCLNAVQEFSSETSRHTTPIPIQLPYQPSFIKMKSPFSMPSYRTRVSDVSSCSTSLSSPLDSPDKLVSSVPNDAGREKIKEQSPEEVAHCSEIVSRSTRSFSVTKPKYRYPEPDNDYLIPILESEKCLLSEMDSYIMRFITSKNTTVLSIFHSFHLMLSRCKQNMSDFYDNYVAVGINEALHTYRRTYGQCNEEYKGQRQVRITGSTCYTLYLYNQNVPEKWNTKIAEIVNSCFRANIYTQYGKTKENAALAIFGERYKNSGRLVTNCGFLIHPNACWLGVSPDGFFITNTKRIVLVEVKVLKAGKDYPIEELASKLEFLVQKGAGNYQLKQRHKFYAQVQLGMMICNLRLAYLLVYCEKSNANIEVPVAFDEIFLKDMLRGLAHVYIKRYLSFLVVNSDKLLLCGS